MPPTLSQTSKLDSLPLSLTWRLLLNTALSPRPEVLWYDIYKEDYADGKLNACNDRETTCKNY